MLALVTTKVNLGLSYLVGVVWLPKIFKKQFPKLQLCCISLSVLPGPASVKPADPMDMTHGRQVSDLTNTNFQLIDNAYESVRNNFQSSDSSLQGYHKHQIQ